MTTTWLQDPALQAGLGPFLAALVWGWLWRRRVAVAAWGVALGFLLTALWVADLRLAPLTSTRKLVWTVLLAALAAALCDRFCPPRRLMHNLWWVLAGGAALWMVWPAVQYRGGWVGAVTAAGALVYAAAFAAAADAARQRPEAARTVAWVMPMGAGGVCLLGASALLGQLGLGLGSAALALWLVGWRWQEAPAAALLPAWVGGALLAVAGAVYAQVPVLALVALALVPLAVWLPLPAWAAEGGRARWARLALAVLPAGAAVAWTAFTEGPVPL